MRSGVVSSLPALRLAGDGPSTGSGRTCGASESSADFVQDERVALEVVYMLGIESGVKMGVYDS